MEDLLRAAAGDSNRIVPLVPLLARPIRNALAKLDPVITIAVLKVSRRLVTALLLAFRGGHQVG